MEENTSLHIDTGTEVLQDIKLIEVSFHEEYNVFDIQLMNIPLLLEYDFVELDISFFPLSRKITSEDYEFEPFEHYIDETKGNKSMYRHSPDGWEHISGLGTSAILTGIVAKFNPNDITQTGSLVSLVSSYYAGMKWVWPWLEGYLINKTARLRTQFKERYYQYTQNVAATGEIYDNNSKKKRYKMENIRPHHIGMVIDSVRQKMRLFFTKQQIQELPSNAEKVNVMNISIPEELTEVFFKDGVDIGVHVKLGNNKRYFPMIQARTELIQTLTCSKKDTYETGCIYGDYAGEKKVFQKGYMEHRETIAINRIKHYKSFEKKLGDIISYKYKPHSDQTMPNISLDKDL